MRATRLVQQTIATPKRKGLAAGGTAVLLWGTLPALRTAAEAIPPMQLAAMALACAAAVGALGWIVGKVQPGDHCRHSLAIWAGAVGGLIGALYFYFIGLVVAPPAQVTLITYIWPLGFVLLLDLRQRGAPRPSLFAGGTLALAGVALVVLPGGDGAWSWDQLPGYLAGLGSGACWIAFSYILQSARTVTTPSYPWFFAAGAAAAALLHTMGETTIHPPTAAAWGAAVAIGIGPYGLAFMAWGYGLRHGPSSTVGVLAYFVPLVATLVLTVFGLARPSLNLALATLAIIGGTLLASRVPRPAATAR